MEDLQSLQKKLMEIQKSGGGFKLSERTVVDIIQKIVNRGKVKLVFTTNGKEYVAEEKITKEISDEVKRNQGRISKFELVKNLEVPSNVIDNKINLLLSRDKSLNVIEGKLITNYYLENMCIEINEMLKVNGCVFLSDLTTKFDLSIDFFKKILRERLSGSSSGSQIIKAKLYETRLLTEEYVQSQSQRVRPILISSTTPIDLTYLVNNYQIDELIIDDLVRGLIDSRVVKGLLTANTFEPTIYSESQASYVKGVLLQNNFIEYAKLKNIGITKNAKEYIKDLQKKEGPSNSIFSDGVYLKEYFITSQLKNQFEYIFFDNLSKGLATNLNSVFLFELFEEDIFSLLDSINYNPNLVCVINMNLIPKTVIDTYVESISPKLKEEASKQYNTYISKMKEKKKAMAEEAEKTSTGKKKGKTGKQKKNKQVDEDEESSENYIQLTPGFKKELESMFFKSPNLEDLHDKEETVSEVFNNFALIKINQLYTQYVNEFIKSKSQNVNDPKTMMNQIENDFLELRFIQKSLENLMNMSNDPNFQSAIKAITAHICKKDLTHLLKNVLTFQLIHMKSKIDINKLNDPNQRKDIISTFSDDDLRQIFTSLNDNLQNKNFLNFMNILQDNSKYMAISLSQLDKKKEKALIEKLSGETHKLIDDKYSLLEKLNKKDSLALTVEMCQSALLKKGMLIKLPYETWAIGLFSTLLPELKAILTGLNEIFNLNDEEFFNRQEEAVEYVKKLFNSY